MQAMKIIPQTAVGCPNCKASIAVEWHVGRVERNETTERKFDVCCRNCDTPYKITVNSREDITYDDVERQKPTQDKGLMLLKYYKEESELYLVVEQDFYYHGKDAPNTDMSYWINEHTCPTNWLRSVRLIADDGDCDPHGVFQFVRAYTYVEIEKQFGFKRKFLQGDDDDNIAEEKALIEIFPELVYGKIIREGFEERQIDRLFEQGEVTIVKK